MSYIKLNFHLISGTKNRRPLITDDIRPRLVKYLGGIIRGFDGVMFDAGGANDHMHVVASLNARHALADVMRDLKGDASTWIHKTFPSASDFDWQDGYSAFTVSESQLPAVIEYVRGQRKHHAKMSFDEELSKLLKLHNVAFDPKYSMG